MDDTTSMQNELTPQYLDSLYEQDKKVFNDFVNSKIKSMDFTALKRLVLSEMTLKNSVRPTKICGFTRKQILNMAQYPEKYGTHILRLMNYMYQKSGYIRRLIDYFSNMAVLNHHVDTEALNSKYFSVPSATLRNNYLKFCAQSSKFNLSNHINSILKRMFLNDVCYAFMVETDIDVSYFFLDPRYCEIRGIVSGNTYKFAINRSMLTSGYFNTLPLQLQELIKQSEDVNKNHMVDIPYECGFCLKYNDNFLHIFPPFFPMIADILVIDEYKDLARTKAINDAYKLLVLKVPTKDGIMTMTDELISPFISTALQVVQDNIGVLPYPDSVDSVEFSSTNSDDRDKVSDATTWAYAEAGVSESLLSGASSGSELKLSILNDSGDIFRIYRSIENWVALQMKLRGFIYRSYRFVYRILDITIFNRQEIIDSELKLAQSSIANKSRVYAAIGVGPSAMLGNIRMEQEVFRDVFDMMEPLKSSYTQTGENDAGAPQKDDDDISPVTETQRENDSNNTENRI